MSDEDPIQQLIEYFSLHTEKELRNQFDKKGAPMHKLFKRQFKIHYNNYDHMMPDELSKRHGVNSIFVMALDDVMCEVRASFTELKNTVLSIYQTMIQEYYSMEAQKLEMSDDPWSAFVEWVRKGNQANYENEFFQAIEVQQESGCYGFDIRRCLYFDILRECGKPELGPILCEYDKILADSVKSWVRFTRRETIATGDKRCDFRYCKV
ncbi:MAG: L-2-amino-thiazoline-4-carboxylic acid hydrolase [Candidatus Thorarchaeota archaeon]